MVERRDDEPRRPAHARRDVEEHHRIDPAGDREHDRAAPVQRPRDLVLEPVRRGIGRIAHRVKLRAGASDGTPPADLDRLDGQCYIPRITRHTGTHLVDFQTNGPLGLIWVGIGLALFFMALVWLNTLLGIFLTPLFLIPQTWILERLKARRDAKRVRGATTERTSAT
jgi:hypothetical protein